MKYPVSTIEDYLQAVPENRRIIPEKGIEIVKEYFPDIQGSLKYDMPSFGEVCSIAS